MQMVASYYGIIDEPDNKRKMHSAPVAYLGGVAVFLG
jgi:UDP-N-acetylmuramyl pentapeptide phosphotransferase/UDP-N-acetylglucosamine-1-phosphate transferase